MPIEEPPFWRPGFRPEEVTNGKTMKRRRPPTTGTGTMARAVLTGLLLSSASEVFAQPNPYNQTFTVFESG
jgi:hypothetical protein